MPYTGHFAKFTCSAAMHAAMHDILCVQLYVTYTKVQQGNHNYYPQPA